MPRDWRKKRWMQRHEFSGRYGHFSFDGAVAWGLATCCALEFGSSDERTFGATYTLEGKISLTCQITANIFGIFRGKCEGESMRNSLLGS